MIPAILAIDLGSSTVKAAVVDHSGALRGTGAGTIELILGGDGAAEQSPDQLWAAVMGACRRAIGASHRSTSPPGSAVPASGGGLTVGGRSRSTGASVRRVNAHR